MPDDSGFPRSSADMRQVHTTVLHRVRLNCVEHFTQEFLEQTSLAFMEEAFIGGLTARLTASIVGVGKDRIRVDREWPRTWWDAFKLRWFPTFIRFHLLRPAVIDSVHIDQDVFAAVCPHHSPLTGDRHRAQDHVAWLCEQDGFWNHNPEDAVR